MNPTSLPYDQQCSCSKLSQKTHCLEDHLFTYKDNSTHPTTNQQASASDRQEFKSCPLCIFNTGTFPDSLCNFHTKLSSFQENTATLDTVYTADKTTTTQSTVYKTTFCGHLELAYALHKTEDQYVSNF